MRPERWIGVWPCLLAFATLVAGCPGGNGGGSKCKSGLTAGDLVITEIMANPVGQDEGGEWFEIHNPSGASLDLDGLRLEAAREDGTGEISHTIDDLSIAAGQYLVLGGMLDEIKPDYVDYAYASDLGSLRNAGGRLSLYCEQALVDRVVYGDMAEGASKSFDGLLTPDAAANDNPEAWCDSRTEFAPDSFGTPGTANEACESDIPPTSCKDDGVVRDVVAPQPGQVVITEFMADPAAADDGTAEWFEVWAGADFDLNGLRYGKTLEDLEQQVASLDCIPVTAGTYLVFAKSDDPAVNGGLPRVDAIMDFSLSNSPAEPAGIYLAYGEQLLDGITYSGSSAGASTALEPTLTDPDQNDLEEHWCQATTPYGDGDLGTPGQANPSCGISPAGQCYENGNLRDLRPPAAGDLVITEFMPNPAAVPDADGEWFELTVLADVDLNGLQVGKTAPDVEFSVPGGDCIPAAAGTQVVFAANLDPLANGGLPEDALLLDMTLGNTNGGIFVAYEDVVLDAITYTSSNTGASTALEPRLTNPADNDNEAYWCEGQDAYGDGDLGTPGAPNPDCGIAPEGQCYDGANLRDLVPPEVGQVIITEFMPNPNAAPDATGEWFELYVGADVDLNGLQIGNDPAAPDDPDDTLMSGDCVRVTAGSYLVMAVSDDPLANGDLPVVDFVVDTSLANSGANLFVGYNDTILDQVAWGASGTGTSTSLDPDAIDALLNDDPLNWCPAVDQYGDGDLGTPGQANPQCP